MAVMEIPVKLGISDNVLMRSMINGGVKRIEGCLRSVVEPSSKLCNCVYL